jgi:hypothetical protein
MIKGYAIELMSGTGKYLYVKTFMCDGVRPVSHFRYKALVWASSKRSGIVVPLGDLTEEEMKTELECMSK